MNSAFYNGKPITSIAALSAALNVPEDILIDMSHNANKYYKKMYRSTITRIGQLGRLHPNQSQKLKNKLAPYKP